MNLSRTQEAIKHSSSALPGSVCRRRQLPNCAFGRSKFTPGDEPGGAQLVSPTLPFVVAIRGHDHYRHIGVSHL